MEGKPILHILYEYQLTIYLTVDFVVKNDQNRTKKSERPTKWKLVFGHFNHFMVVIFF